MSFKTVKLGDYIQLVKQSFSNDLLLSDVRGVSISKMFMPTKANMEGVDIVGYNIVNVGQFAFNPNTARMGEKICVALNNEKPFLVSKIYPVFEIIKKDELLSEYLYLYFARSEFDRYVRFNSWGSARETFNFEDFCNIWLPLPDVETQKKYIAIHDNISKLQKSYEKSLADLQLITDTFMDDLAKKIEPKKLGDYINAIDNRNRSDIFDENDLRGISTSKLLIRSKANTSGVSFSSYKIVNFGEFAYVSDTSRRGDKIAIALNDDKPFIVSSIYTTFEIIDKSQLIPEFLLLWFKRPEFDRYARFNSWGSARETFDWSELSRVKLPIPSIEIQKSIVEIHHALESRKQQIIRLKELLKQVCPVLIKNAKDKVLGLSQ